MPFKDRAEAGQRLAAALAPYRTQHPLILALPRGGVAVGAEIARTLAAPLDLILVRKIGVPFEPELAMGAVVNGGDPVVVRNDNVILMANIREAEFAHVRDQELAEIARRHHAYLGDRAALPVRGRTAIVVDDGIATGATMRAALQATRLRHPQRLVLAVPVAAVQALEGLEAECDAIICLERYHDLRAIGYYYDSFPQLGDDDVIRLLNELRRD